MDICMNCGAELSSKFCPNCGQERITKRLEIKTIVHDVTHGIFHWENNILLTFKLLLIHPGNFIRSYIRGKRKSYIRPFSYFLFFQTFYVIVFHLMSSKYFAYLNITVTPGSQAEKVAEIQHVISNNVNYLNFILPLIFAFIFKLFLKKKTDVNYAEGLVFSFYTFATVLIFGAFFMLLSMIDIRFWNIRFLFNFVYLSFAVMQFSGFSKVKGFLTGAAVIILSYFVFIILVAALTYGYIAFSLR